MVVVKSPSTDNAPLLLANRSYPATIPRFVASSKLLKSASARLTDAPTYHGLVACANTGAPMLLIITAVAMPMRLIILQSPKLKRCLAPTSTQIVSCKTQPLLVVNGQHDWWRSNCFCGDKLFCNRIANKL